MRQSTFFARTKKEASKEAATISHQLLVRADFISQLSAGVYSLLPLGYRTFKKIEQIVREEMNDLGGQEFFMPTLIPKNLWQETGRWDTIDPPLFVVKDRHDKEFGLGSTHEEVITDLVRHRVESYKDLPFSLYQIQNKFRNEMRSTGGLLRVREFIMKDLYSFHRDRSDLDDFYQKTAQAYKNIYQKCGVDVVMVEASSGSIGGNESHEFMIIAQFGEDTIWTCTSCDWAANIETVSEVKDCPKCHQPVKQQKSIEAGHIFKLDDKYSSKMKAKFIDDDGVSKPIVMGCYGIGLGRLMATIIEALHDDRGMIWPESVAPFKVHLISLNEPDKADKIYDKLVSSGFDVLYDDRQSTSAGEKFADSDLIGIPYRLVVSQKTGDKIEFKKRASKEVELMTIDQVINSIGK